MPELFMEFVKNCFFFNTAKLVMNLQIRRRVGSVAPRAARYFSLAPYERLARKARTSSRLATCDHPKTKTVMYEGSQPAESQVVVCELLEKSQNLQTDWNSRRYS